MLKKNVHTINLHLVPSKRFLAFSPRADGMGGRGNYTVSRKLTSNRLYQYKAPSPKCVRLIKTCSTIIISSGVMSMNESLREIVPMDGWDGWAGKLYSVT